jgi:excisionase family DNA binding protein
MGEVERPFGTITDHPRPRAAKEVVSHAHPVLDSLVAAFADAVVERMTSARQTSSSPARLMSVAQAAEYLGRTADAMKHLISEGSLRTVRSDRRVFLDRLDLDRWIDEHKA